jgi:hypothetical protein
MMLCAAIAGFAVVVHTGSDAMGFLAGMAAGALSWRLFLVVLVIYLGTNQYATGLALSLFGVGFSAFVGISYVQEKLPPRPSFEIPFLADIPLGRPRTLQAASTGVWRHRFCFCINLVPLQNSHWLGAADLWVNPPSRRMHWAIRFDSFDFMQSLQARSFVWAGWRLYFSGLHALVG